MEDSSLATLAIYILVSTKHVWMQEVLDNLTDILAIRTYLSCSEIVVTGTLVKVESLMNMAKKTNSLLLVDMPPLNNNYLNMFILSKKSEL